MRRVCYNWFISLAVISSRLQETEKRDKSCTHAHPLIGAGPVAMVTEAVVPPLDVHALPMAAHVGDLYTLITVLPSERKTRESLDGVRELPFL